MANSPWPVYQECLLVFFPKSSMWRCVVFFLFLFFWSHPDANRGAKSRFVLMFLWRSISDWLILRMMTCHPALFHWYARKNVIVVIPIFFFYLFFLNNNAKFSFMASMKYLWLVNFLSYFTIGQCGMVVILGPAWKHITAFVRNKNQHF